mmetsp:Transcript_5254/g.3694  ORF Transcript_5254/g.3694 Transcript_5254/m.3694 type:complete len:102 (+) Transcript_5254:40-345(+)
MLQRGIVGAQRRTFSSKVISYRGRNINTAEHNKERRANYSIDFGFLPTLNLGLEGYSKTSMLDRMDPFVGHKNEFIYLFALMALVTFLSTGRQNNEDGLRN